MLRLEFTQKFPAETPSELKVFSLEKARVDQSLISNILSRLGLAAGPGGFRWRSAGGWTTAESQEARLAIQHLSGAVRFWMRVNDRELAKLPFSIGEPSLAFIARNFLKKTGLVAGNVDQFKVRNIAYLRMQTASAQGKAGPPKVLDAGVIFSREIDAVPVSGPGGFVMINVAADESVIGGTKVWRAAGETLGTVRVLKPEFAIDQLQRSLRAQGIDRPVQVLKAELCYFERGENDEQSYLEPAYAFVYEYKTKQNRFPYKSTFVIPAFRGSRQAWNLAKRY